MTRAQFCSLNLTSSVLVLLLLAHLIMARLNSQLGSRVSEQRAFINNSRQVETVLDSLSKRIAAGSQSDPHLKTILVKYDLSDTLDLNGKPKSSP
jgi:hypothetical protein